MTAQAARPLYVIAEEIVKDFPRAKRVYAEDYLQAMRYLNEITDSYYQDSAKSVVLYFLNNAKNWQGETARRIKAELRGMVGVK
jgi:hypothetical protein